jgi:BirA family biotin operon repressor/biotin-[acetyl-CoA-carboxylase] ligase
MQLIDDGMAQHGWVIWTDYQSKGKGQRGNTWQDHLENLKFSLIITPQPPMELPFQLSMLISVTLVKYLRIILPETSSVAIKWPNDIYINDKKACGILIENVFRGRSWSYAIIGIGLNINQRTFPDTLNNATSLSIESEGKDFEFIEIITDLRNGILNELKRVTSDSENDLLHQYNSHLYLKGKSVHFMERSNERKFEAYVLEVEQEGKLVLLSSMGVEKFEFGSVKWLL